MVEEDEDDIELCCGVFSCVVEVFFECVVKCWKCGLNDVCCVKEEVAKRDVDRDGERWF